MTMRARARSLPAAWGTTRRRTCGRRAIARLLFAASYVPYFLPNESRPAFFRDDFASLKADETEEGKPVVDRADARVAKELDDLFSQEVLPEKRSKGGR